MKGGGHVSQVYAIRQAIAKAVVAYYAKNFDAASAFELKKKLVAYDRALLIADPRRMEPKKFGGQGARARRQKRFVFMPRPLISFGTCSYVSSQLPLSGWCIAYGFLLPLCMSYIRTLIAFTHVIASCQKKMRIFYEHTLEIQKIYD